MGKKILYIVLGALVVFGLLFLLWTWLFGGAKNNTDGGLGGAGNASSTLGSAPDTGNGQTTLPTGLAGYNAQGVYVGPGSGAYDSQGNYVGIPNPTTSTSTLGGGLTTVNGVTWLGSPFNPSDINSVSSGAGGFAPTITSQIDAPGGDNSLVGILAITAIAGGLSCALRTASVAAATAAGTAAVSAVTAAGVAAVPVRDAGSIASAGSNAYKATLQTGDETVSFAGCIVNVLAKVALQQITASVVNWINSGFNGKPAFVTNYQQFFTNVADSAAGQFIQGSALAFLCSPFQLQIKIAIAQSYANRNAQSCTLTKVIGNVNNFMKGNFSQGGWGGFVSFTTIPTNNPYGAFAYAQVGLQTAQQNALSNANRNITPTGFLSMQEAYSCQESGSNGQTVVGGGVVGQKFGGTCPTNCRCRTTTPGTVIESSLNKTIGSGIDQLGLASSIDQIITALINQLMVRTLQNGLSSLSQSTTQSPADIAAQSQGVTLLNDMQSRATFAQQLGSIYQGSISDIQSAQAGLNDLANCWSSVASSTGSASAAQNAAEANVAIQSLEAQVTALNDKITQVNSTIAELNQFESRVSLASSAGDINKITADYNAAVSAGDFPSQTDLTTASQDRATLQSQLAATNQSTQAGMTQCNAAAGQ